MNEQVKVGKHPKALYVLFFTEMWERFAYYLMVGILLSLLLIDTTTGGKGFSQEHMGADIVGSIYRIGLPDTFHRRIISRSLSRLY
ncbi:MAG: hypothetical protein V9E88_08320 [Ferruginibacter sp.]